MAFAMEGNLEIYLSARGFFIVVFDCKRDENTILDYVWMWEENMLQLKSWHPNFDPSTESFSVLSIWVRLPNLPLHY